MLFTYLFRTTCLVNGKTYWGLHQSNDLLFDLPCNQIIGWPNSRYFNEDYEKYGATAFHHNVIAAFPTTDVKTIEKAFETHLDATPRELRYNIGSVKTPEQLQAMKDGISQYTFITNGKETRRVKKEEKIPKGWKLGNGNLMNAEQRAAIRLEMRANRGKKNILTSSNTSEVAEITTNI